MALLLARALTLGCWKEAEIIADIIRRCLQERRRDLRFPAKDNILEYPFSYMETTAVAPFLLNLYASWSGTPFPLEGLPLHPAKEYETLLALWQTDDLTALEAALFAACETHMKQSKCSPVAFVDFASWIHILYPVELLAVLRLRENKGLPNPTIHHPLLQPPFGRLFEILTVEHKAVMDQAVANYLPTIPTSGSYRERSTGEKWVDRSCL